MSRAGCSRLSKGERGTAVSIQDSRVSTRSLRSEHIKTPEQDHLSAGRDMRNLLGACFCKNLALSSWISFIFLLISWILVCIAAGSSTPWSSSSFSVTHLEPEASNLVLTITWYLRKYEEHLQYEDKTFFRFISYGDSESKFPKCAKTGNQITAILVILIPLQLAAGIIYILSRFQSLKKLRILNKWIVVAVVAVMVLCPSLALIIFVVGPCYGTGGVDAQGNDFPVLNTDEKIHFVIQSRS